MRKLASWPRALYASPTYLAGASPLAAPADLVHHALIVGPQGIGDCTFRRDGTTVSMRLDGRLRIPALEGTITAAVAGMGVIMASIGACQRDIDAGTLVRVLPEWDLGMTVLHAVFPAGRAAKASARAFVAYLTEGVV